MPGVAAACLPASSRSAHLQAARRFSGSRKVIRGSVSGYMRRFSKRLGFLTD